MFRSYTFTGVICTESCDHKQPMLHGRASLVCHSWISRIRKKEEKKKNKKEKSNERKVKKEGEEGENERLMTLRCIVYQELKGGRRELKGGCHGLRREMLATLMVSGQFGWNLEFRSQLEFVFMSTKYKHPIIPHPHTHSHQTGEKRRKTCFVNYIQADVGIPYAPPIRANKFRYANARQQLTFTSCCVRFAHSVLQLLHLSHLLPQTDEFILISTPSVIVIQADLLCEEQCVHKLKTLANDKQR